MFNQIIKSASPKRRLITFMIEKRKEPMFIKRRQRRKIEVIMCKRFLVFINGI